MTKTRNLSDLLDGNGDVKSANLDNVPASDNASALTTGTLPAARLPSIPDANLSNQAKVVKGTSAPSNPQAGDLWYDTNTGINRLKVYNTISNVWVSTNATSPTITSLTSITENQSGNITLTGTGFGVGSATVSFTPSGGSASTASATPTSDTELTVAIPSAIYGQSVGTSIAVFVSNSEGLSSATTNISIQGVATGGTVTNVGGKRIHTFTSSGNLVVPASTTLTNVEFLVVAGGGGGGGSSSGVGGAGGGGGGGGYRSSVTGEISGGGASAENKLSLATGTYTITIGAGGAGGTNSSDTDGNDSSIVGTGINVTSTGGGHGGSYATNAVGSDGGSGGGQMSGHTDNQGGSGTSGQGYAGGQYLWNPPTYSYIGGGGGGGAGSVGGNARSSSPNGGDGGTAVTTAINGNNVSYARGGGGGSLNGSPSPNGGKNANQPAASANTGNAGGGVSDADGGNHYNGGNGGSGIVIVRY
tara:strand:+ start:1317 stop:2738 length:1422 start_codon:yes stop_codon:yes gene_type:complete